MADRVSASIVIGGAITAPQYDDLIEIIVSERLSIEWGGAPFNRTHRTVGEPLRLYDHEVAWGCFEELEAWCLEHKLPFARWSGGYASQWGPERLVFTGDGEPRSYAVDEEDRVVVCKETIEHLGSMEAIIAYFGSADFVVPPLVVAGDAAAASTSIIPPDAA